MSASTNMVFSESTNKTGMYELFQDLTKTNSTSYTAYKYARDANNALADYFMRAIAASGTWLVDDSNQTDYPEIKVNLVNNQFDYPLTSDASSTANQILEIQRVECATESTADASKFKVLLPYDALTNNVISTEPTYTVSPNLAIVAQRNITGVPYRYSKRANSIFLDPTPNFSATNGLRVFFSRTPTYFAGTDTTKVAGIPHAHQEYLVYRPAYLYCITNLPKLAAGYYAYVKELEKKIDKYYGRRDQDQRKIMMPKKILYI